MSSIQVMAHPEPVIVGEHTLRLCYDEGHEPSADTRARIAALVREHRRDNPQSATACLMLQSPDVELYVVVSPTIIVATASKDFADGCLAAGTGGLG